MTSDHVIAQSPRKPALKNLSRWLLAGPVTLVFALLAMMAMPVWFPRGAAGIDHLVFSLILFPGWWALGFFYVLLEPKQWRAWLIMAAAVALNSVMVGMALTQGN